MNTIIENGSASCPGARYAVRERKCALCNGPAYRIPRRFIDLITSLLVSVGRYRCRSLGCGWEGNLRQKRRSLYSDDHAA